MTAAIENPEAVEAYRSASPVRMPEIAKREEAIAKGQERQRAIRKRVREIAARDRVDATTALITLQRRGAGSFRGLRLECITSATQTSKSPRGFVSFTLGVHPQACV